jgi:hypothetical protein
LVAGLAEVVVAPLVLVRKFVRNVVGSGQRFFNERRFGDFC